MSATSATEFERRRIAAGGRNIRLVLTPEAAAALARLQSASGMNARAVVERAILLADRAQTEHERSTATPQ